MKLINFFKKNITTIVKPILKVCISVLMFFLIFLTIIRFAEVITLNLNSNLDSVLVRLSMLLNRKTLLQLIIGSPTVMVITAGVYVIGLACDWFISLFKNQNHTLIRFYLKLTDIINYWYPIIAIITWTTTALTDTLFNYFAIIISLIAILHDMRSDNTKLLKIKVIPHHFLVNESAEEE